ncbi:MAG: fluoride efflux transporter CrcB [Gammaproteobacteria bacterium]|nr:fluoride efflux transporter CrcB [Gammaproteobacteria bacterium]
MLFKTTLFIAFGGAIGAVGRFFFSNLFYDIFGRNFPYGTLAVNIVGSLLIGFFYVVFVEKMTLGPDLRTFIIVGMFGAFTTFSTFSLETLLLIQQGNTLKALLNVILSVILCLFACWLGMILSRI